MLFRERGRETGKHGCERETSSVVSYTCLGQGSFIPGPGIEPANLGMCPDWELNQELFDYGTMLQPAEPHGQGQNSGFCNLLIG